MGLIYANTELTIAATSAKSSEEGFLNLRADHKIAIELDLGKASKVKDIVFFRQPSDFIRDFEENVTKSPLSARGWVLQERLLSRRTVQFAKK